ncbi:MAG TPA: class I SAM-dependent methyltransferase, partial [Candidatus Nanoarchaeia archaeon]|nr:class I SAM-dependent methyltransferase [Candidatus Nanoarchaeia archaeon]
EGHIDAILRKDKKKLFSQLKGQILEIGAGTGSNLEYYPKKSKVVCLEPNSAMHKYLRSKAQEENLNIHVITGTAEDIPLESATIDAVVSTHVLCSVDSVEKVVKEIKRVLKNNGSFVFIEHVAAKEGFLQKVQNVLAPLWSALFDHCQINRDIGKIIQSEFKKVKIKQKKFAFPIVSPHIVGFAKK